MRVYGLSVAPSSTMADAPAILATALCSILLGIPVPPSVPIASVLPGRRANATATTRPGSSGVRRCQVPYLLIRDALTALQCDSRVRATSYKIVVSGVIVAVPYACGWWPTCVHPLSRYRGFQVLGTVVRLGDRWAARSYLRDAVRGPP